MQAKGGTHGEHGVQGHRNAARRLRHGQRLGRGGRRREAVGQRAALRGGLPAAWEGRLPCLPHPPLAAAHRLPQPWSLLESDEGALPSLPPACGVTRCSCFEGSHSRASERVNNRENKEHFVWQNLGAPDFGNRSVPGPRAAGCGAPCRRQGPRRPGACWGCPLGCARA